MTTNNDRNPNPNRNRNENRTQNQNPESMREEFGTEIDVTKLQEQNKTEKMKKNNRTNRF